MNKICFVAFSGLVGDGEIVTFLYGDDEIKRYFVGKDRDRITEFLDKDLKFVIDKEAEDTLEDLYIEIDKNKLIKIEDSFISTFKCVREEVYDRYSMTRYLNIEFKEAKHLQKVNRGFDVCKTLRNIFEAIIRKREQ